MTAPNNM